MNAPKNVHLPYVALPRTELEIMGCRVILDAKNDEIATVPFDEDADFIAEACNQYAELCRLRDAVSAWGRGLGGEQAVMEAWHDCRETP